MNKKFLTFGKKFILSKVTKKLTRVVIAELDATMGRSEDLIPEWETPRRPKAGTEVGDRFCRASSRTSEFQFPKSWTFGRWVRKKIAESQKIALIPNIWTPPSFVKFAFFVSCSKLCQSIFRFWSLQDFWQSTLLITFWRKKISFSSKFVKFLFLVTNSDFD